MKVIFSWSWYDCCWISFETGGVCYKSTSNYLESWRCFIFSRPKSILLWLILESNLANIKTLEFLWFIFYVEGTGFYWIVVVTRWRNKWPILKFLFLLLGQLVSYKILGMLNFFPDLLLLNYFLLNIRECIWHTSLNIIVPWTMFPFISLQQLWVNSSPNTLAHITAQNLLILQYMRNIVITRTNFLCCISKFLLTCC